jgi:hypothetical protein
LPDEEAELLLADELLDVLLPHAATTREAITAAPVPPLRIHPRLDARDRCLIILFLPFGSGYWWLAEPSLLPGRDLVGAPLAHALGEASKEISA